MVVMVVTFVCCVNDVAVSTLYTYIHMYVYIHIYVVIVIFCCNSHAVITMSRYVRLTQGGEAQWEADVFFLLHIRLVFLFMFISFFCIYLYGYMFETTLFSCFNMFLSAFL